MSGEPRHEAFVWVGCVEAKDGQIHFPCNRCEWKSNLTAGKPMAAKKKR